MLMTDATITIRNLRLRTYIGFKPEELEKKQDVIINTSISYAANHACATDEAENALDYKVITKSIIGLVESGRFKLLEKLCADVLSNIAENHFVTKVSVTIEKPHALRFADSVSVTLSAKRSE